MSSGSRIRTPSRAILEEAIAACITNSERLSDESYYLEFREPPRLQLYILLIAQEELAKAFILLLVRDGIISFSRPLLRAMNDHACKQLAGVIMDYIIMRWDTLEEAQEMIRSDQELGHRLPSAIESAVMLLRFEKVGRWETNAWVWNEPPQYDRDTKKIAEGYLDQRKQDALYVRVGGDGRISLPTPITKVDIDQESERLGEFGRLVDGLLKGTEPAFRYSKTISFIRTMFDTPV